MSLIKIENTEKIYKLFDYYSTYGVTLTLNQEVTYENTEKNSKKPSDNYCSFGT